MKVSWEKRRDDLDRINSQILRKQKRLCEQHYSGHRSGLERSQQQKRASDQQHRSGHKVYDSDSRAFPAIMPLELTDCGNLSALARCGKCARDVKGNDGANGYNEDV